MTEMATFAADLNGERIMCRVETSALLCLCPDYADDPMRALVEQRSRVQDVARRLIELERFEEDGSVLIRDSDF